MLDNLKLFQHLPIEPIFLQHHIYLDLYLQNGNTKSF